MVVPAARAYSRSAASVAKSGARHHLVIDERREGRLASDGASPFERRNGDFLIQRVGEVVGSDRGMDGSVR